VTRTVGYVEAQFPPPSPPGIEVQEMRTVMDAESNHDVRKICLCRSELATRVCFRCDGSRRLFLRAFILVKSRPCRPPSPP
jgi:hypothetical protein